MLIDVLELAGAEEEVLYLRGGTSSKGSDFGRLMRLFSFSNLTWKLDKSKSCAMVVAYCRVSLITRK